MSSPAKRLDPFERYLTFWVALCMVLGLTLAREIPGFVDTLRRLEPGSGSQVNIPVATAIALFGPGSGAAVATVE